MFPFFTINKTYTISKPIGDVVTTLDTIISSPYKNSVYSIYGQFISVDPPSFLFRPKMELFRPWFQQIFSTKLITTLANDNGKTKIIASTRSNPSFLIATLILILGVVVNIFRIEDWSDLKILLGYMLGIVLVVVVDKLSKNVLLASFERHIR